MHAVQFQLWWPFRHAWSLTIQPMVALKVMVILADCISVLLLMHENLQKHNTGGKQRLMTCTWKSNKLASTGEVYSKCQ